MERETDFVFLRLLMIPNLRNGTRPKQFYISQRKAQVRSPHLRAPNALNLWDYQRRILAIHETAWHRKLDWSALHP